MYAIVEASGRQYQLEAGRFVDIDLVPFEPGQEYVFERVLMIVDGKESQVGQPYVAGARVTGKVLSHGRDKKIIVYKMRPKKGTRKKQGHRQGFTRVYVSSICVNDKVLAEARDEAKAAKPAKAKAEPAVKEESTAAQDKPATREKEAARQPAEKKAPAKSVSDKPAAKKTSEKGEKPAGEKKSAKKAE